MVCIVFHRKMNWIIYSDPLCFSSVVMEKPEELEEGENTVVYKTPHCKTVIIYKNDFVPYTTRIYNFIKSFSSEPGTGDK